MAISRRRSRRLSPVHVSGAFELFVKSSRLVRGNIWIFGPLYCVPLIFAFYSWVATPEVASQNGRRIWHDYSWLGGGFSLSSVPAYLWYALIGTSFIWVIFVLIASFLTQIMAQEAQISVAEGRKAPGLDQLWIAARTLGRRMFGLYLLMGVYIALPTLIWLLIYEWFGLLAIVFVPLIGGSVLMLRRYFLAPYILLDRECGITEAMDASAEITTHHTNAIWPIIGLMALIGCLNAIPIIGWFASFILGSLYSVAPALRYQELKQLS